ncbi:MAG TPA: amidohydrolase, partial [Blastocatellia bacterium]|nr:amidohydrolase [Blastocatellia bacterium]
MKPFIRTNCISLVLLVALLATVAVPNRTMFAQADKPEDKKDEKKEELPLKPEGKVSFTTDEGTWMSLDVSPDGQTIVFDLVGDLYTLSINGGEAKCISSGMPFDSQPKFSPDGKWIAFLSERSGGENVWICKPDGSDTKPITKGRGNDIQMFVSPSWT